MSFNAKEYLQTLEVPTLIVEGENGEELVFKGQLVSFNDVLPYLSELENLEELNETDLRERLVPSIVKTIKMPEEAIPHLLKLPTGVILEAIADFFVCLKGFRKKAK